MTRSDAAAKWRATKPLVMALAVGLVVGPLATNYLGWQVTGRTARADLRAGIVEQQALFCEARVRAVVAAPGELDWEARHELAKKWATIAGKAEPESGVVNACAGKLAV